MVIRDTIFDENTFLEDMCSTILKLFLYLPTMHFFQLHQTDQYATYSPYP